MNKLGKLIGKQNALILNKIHRKILNDLECIYEIFSKIADKFNIMFEEKIGKIDDSPIGQILEINNNDSLNNEFG